MKKLIQRLFPTVYSKASADSSSTAKSPETQADLERQLIPHYKKQLKQSLKEGDLLTHAKVAEKLIALSQADGYYAKIKHLRQRGETNSQLFGLTLGVYRHDPSPRSALLLAQYALDLEQLGILPPLIEVVAASDLPDAASIEVRYCHATQSRTKALELLHERFASPILCDESRSRLFNLGCKLFSSEMGELAQQQLQSSSPLPSRLLSELGAHFFTLRLFDSVDQTVTKLQAKVPWDALFLACLTSSHRDPRQPHWHDAHLKINSAATNGDPDAARLLPQFWRHALAEAAKYGHEGADLSRLAHSFFEAQSWQARDLDLAIGLIRRLAKSSRAELESFVALLKRKLWQPDLPATWLGNTLLQTGKLADVLSYLGLFDTFLDGLPLDLPRRDQAWAQAYDFATAQSCGAQNAAIIHEWGHCQHHLTRVASTYFDARVSASARDRLMELIHDALRLRQPFSALRLGDGEVYGFPWSKQLSLEQHQNDMLIRENHWWGRTINQETRDYVINGFIEAVHSADLLGIPNSFRLLRDTDINGADLYSRTSRSIVVVCQHIAALCYGGQINLTRTSFTDERFHQILFAQFGDLRRLVNAATRVIIVSCYSEKLITSQLPELSHPYIIQIPPHTMTAELSDYPDKGVILPEILPQLLSHLKAIAEPGSLVLVAAGFAGKMFLHTAKQAGGVALDVGATLDYWLGLKTRSHVDLV